MSELEPIDAIQRRLKKAALRAQAPNHSVSVEIRVIERHPLGRRNEMINELYPAADGRLTTRPTTILRLAGDLERTAWKCLKGMRGADQQMTRQLAIAIRSALETPRAEYFVVDCPDDGWRWAEIFWNRWYLAIDRSTGRCISLTVGASH